jgi:transposase
MKEEKPLNLEQVRAFLEASEEIRFEGRNRKEIYYWVKQTLIEQQYQVRGKAEKGLLRSYAAKMTGLSRAQVTRLIGQYVGTGQVEERVYRRRRFPSLYTRRDIELLAEVDEAHETLSGPATQKILYREYHEYGGSKYERLARISMAHIYNLRKSGTYRKRRGSLSGNATNKGEHWGETEAGPAGQARVPASRHGTSG